MQPRFKTLDRSAAFDWIRQSLDDGSTFAHRVHGELASFQGAYLLASGPDDPREFVALSDRGFGWTARAALEEAEQAIRALTSNGMKTLLVEDELARWGEANIGGPLVYVGQSVLRWIELTENAEDAVTHLRQSSSGYPLNAYVLLKDPSALGMTDGTQWSRSKDLELSLVGAVIVSAFDGEAYVLATRQHL